MKKMVMLLVMVMAMAGAVSAFAAEGSTPVKVSLIPTVGVPAQEVVHGLDLGIIGDNVKEVQGLQLSWIYSGTKEKLVGAQLGFVNIGNNVSGLQYGFYNQAENMKGLQFGFINSAVNMSGLQVGLVNLIKNGRLPFMVIVNGNW